MVVGGLTNNILAPQYVEKQHAEKVFLALLVSPIFLERLYSSHLCHPFPSQVLHLTVAPPTLLRLTLEFISSNR